MSAKVGIRIGLFLGIFASCVLAESRPLTKEEKAFAIQAPQPEYPEAAKSKNITGAGVFEIRADVKTGKVKKVTILRSTGSSVLDKAALNTLQKWIFKPNALPPISSTQPQRKDKFANEDALIDVPISFQRKK